MMGGNEQAVSNIAKFFFAIWASIEGARASEKMPRKVLNTQLCNPPMSSFNGKLNLVFRNVRCCDLAVTACKT